MEKTIPLTQKFFDMLTEKLHQMETTERMEVTAAIKQAKEFGDLSENAEYSAAKERQAKLEIDIIELTDTLAKAYPIDMSMVGTKCVGVGNKVKIFNEKFNKTFEYTMVSDIEANSGDNKISIDSPIGKSILGKKKGDEIDVEIPAGTMRIRIENISK